MQRDEKVARIALKSGKVLLISNLVIIQRFLHPDYLCIAGPRVIAGSETLAVFELLHKIEGIPSFTARWDAGRAHTNPLELDIEITGTPISIIRDFKNNRHGYGSHQIDKSLDFNRRQYDVQIKAAGGILFEAGISFFNTDEIVPRENVGLSDAVDTAMRRAELLTRTSERPVGEINTPRSPADIRRRAWLREKIRSFVTFLSDRLL